MRQGQTTSRRRTAKRQLLSLDAMRIALASMRPAHASFRAVHRNNFSALLIPLHQKAAHSRSLGREDAPAFTAYRNRFELVRVRLSRDGMIGITIEHQQIKNWTTCRGGRPVISNQSSHEPAIVFTGEGQDHDVNWDEWLARFDAGEWAFIYQDRTQEGEPSQYCRVVPRFGERK
jgi:hypothetical protein